MKPPGWTFRRKLPANPFTRTCRVIVNIHLFMQMSSCINKKMCYNNVKHKYFRYHGKGLKYDYFGFGFRNFLHRLGNIG